MSAPLRFPPAEVFIETGHGFGGTLDDIVKGPYLEIHSIELSAELAEHGCERFRKYPRVHVHHGSSPAILPAVCDPNRETVFWLDAHYSGGNYVTDQTDPVHGQCPVLAELTIIRGLEWRVPPIIFIDDVPCFFPGPYTGIYANCDPAQFPKLEDIEAALPTGYQMQIKRQWRPFPRALSNFKYLGRQRYLKCTPSSI